MIAQAALVAVAVALAASLATPAAPSRRRRGPSWAYGPIRARFHAWRRVRGSTGRLGSSWAREPGDNPPKLPAS